MGKKCMICSAPAKFAIKGTSDFYCEHCAEENFEDISCLENLEDAEKKKIDDEDDFDEEEIDDEDSNSDEEE